MVKKYFLGLFDLFYPSLCLACGNNLFNGEETLCVRCLSNLPKTNFHSEPVNPVIKHFWGKVPVHSATAYYHFHKGDKVQKLIHQLKYKNHPEIGVKVGKMLGNDLAESSLFNTVEMVMPVPLHANKLRMRGYNQSEQLARGIAAALGVSYDDSLQRNKHTATQTKKHRYERFENVNSVFEIRNAAKLTNKHILIVDDVITTGSTLVACAEELLRLQHTKVSVAAMAYAAH